MIGLIIDDMVPKLLNDQPDSLTDLKIYRSRQAEIMFHLMYKELMMAHSEYKRNLNFGNEEAKVFLKPDYIIECLLGVHVHSKGNSTLESVQTYNPVGELKLASKLIKTGPGGIPNKRSFKKEHRGIHKSYHGNIGANATSEYADVGIVNHMTLTPLISNQYGSYGIKDIKACSGWDLVSMDEALVPFINELDPTRAILAYTHRSQASPMINGEEPLVATGAEYIIPQLSSSRFIQRAKTDGIVKSVGEDDYVEVQYKDGTKEFIDITPRLATTKRASYVRLGLNHLEVGDKFKMNEMVAWTNTFNGECYASGKNMKMAVMNYMGYSHEDGYVISNNTAESVQTETVEEVSVIIPTGTKVHKLKYQKGQTEVNETLVEFSYVGDLEEYIDKYNLLDNESSEEDVALYSSIGNNIVISSPGGEISQIRIYLNNKNDADPLIIEFWKEIVSELKAKEKRYASTVKTKEKQLKAIDNLDMSQIKTGTHKYRGIQFEGARISFFIKKTNSLLIGDKLANRYGGKGVITKIIKDKDQPKAETFGDIDIFISPISVLGRKNLAVVKELYIGKIMYYLPLVLKEKVNDRRATSKSIRDLILSVYDELDTTPTKKVVQSIKDKFKIISDVKLRQLINDDKLKMNIIIEPFTNIPIENIKSAAELLDIELDERVWIPKTNTWTKTKVPVGMQYINSLEQLAEDYESLRSTGGYMSLTGQPKKGRADMGGQSIGNLDVYNLLTYNCPHVLEEFMTFRSDDFKNKRISTIDIIQNGNTSMPKKTGGAGTHNLHKVHMIAMGLKVE
jgi:DNA-directed RNA polymerase subunit beta